jgi:hypothetical protein
VLQKPQRVAAKKTGDRRNSEGSASMPVGMGRRVVGHTIITVPIEDLPFVFFCIVERAAEVGRAPVNMRQTPGHERPTGGEERKPLSLFTRNYNVRDIRLLPELSCSI